MKRLEINKTLIPYYFYIVFAGERFKMEVNYNQTGDFFTIALWAGDELLCAGEKVVYGIPLFRDISDRRFPKVTITPLDASNQTNEATYGMVGITVFLVVEDGEEDG